MSWWDKVKWLMWLTALWWAAGYAITRPGAPEAISSAISNTSNFLWAKTLWVLSSVKDYVGQILTNTWAWQVFAWKLAPFAIPAMWAYIWYQCRIWNLLKDSYWLGKWWEIFLNCIWAWIWWAIGVVWTMPAYLPVSTMIWAWFLAYQTAKLGKWGLQKTWLIKSRTA